MGVADKHQVGRAGEHFVAAELHRRGAYVALFVGNMPDIDIQPSNTSRTRTISIQVKTRTKGSWHSDIRKGQPMKENPADDGNTRRSACWATFLANGTVRSKCRPSVKSSSFTSAGRPIA